MLGRCWCITSWAECGPEWCEETMKYLCFQKEKSKEGKEHWQGYVEFQNSTRLNTVKSSIGDKSAHCELRKGTREQARDYCRKKESAVAFTFEEYGEWAKDGQGKRNDMIAACKCKTIEEVKDKYPSQFVRYFRGFSELIRSKPRTCKPTVTILWGPTGTGKSHRANEIAKSNKGDVYWKPPGRWWQDYSGEVSVIIDEFGTDWEGWSANFMLRLLDKWPVKVENKGGSKEFSSPNIIITSHTDPATWWPTRWDEVRRRVDNVHHVDRLGAN